MGLSFAGRDRATGFASALVEQPVHLIAVVAAIATALLAGQPIYANDTWVHLALGEAFLANGPWLAADPHLTAAPGPPSPSSWLGSVAIYVAYHLCGFTGLRIAHALFVLVILLLAWRAMRRAGAVPIVASVGLIGFIALATYRLVQLRPDLFTIAALIALLPSLSASPDGPDARRMTGAALVTAVWANVHAAFVLGPILVLGAGLVLLSTSSLPGEPTSRRTERRRGRRLTMTGLAMSAAGLLNPSGPSAYLAYFDSGRETLALEAVIDEWGPTNLLAWPVPALPPTIAAWLVCWLGVACVVIAAIAFVRERWAGWSGGAEWSGRRVDPVLLSWAAAGVVAAILASRFLWLVFLAFVLIGAWIGSTIDAGTSSRHADSALRRWLALASAVAIAALHFTVGDWPLVSQAMRTDGADYAAPYPAERFATTAVWFLADTGVEGRIFNDYPIGGFMSFWLAPHLRMASSGTMNVAKDAMDAHFAIGSRQQIRAGESYAELLDRRGFDLFLGLGFPIEATQSRPVPCTVRHLDHEPGWLLIFRNLRSSIYLRRNARNATNLDRVTAYYAQAGVPFDRDRGFDAAEVLTRTPAWAIAHGLVPADFPALLATVHADLSRGQVDFATQRLAVVFAILGLYDRALEVDRAIAQANPLDASVAWRMIWSEVQRGRWSEAFATADEYERRVARSGAGANPLGSLVAQLRQSDPRARRTLAAHLPVLRPEQLDWVLRDVRVAPARLERPGVRQPPVRD